MDFSIFRQKDFFPSFVSQRLSTIPIDYKEKYHLIKNADILGSKQLAAGVVLLLNYKKNQNGAEYVFQLIKRSDMVLQAGDISCPGGMLHPKTDKILSYLLADRIISTMPDRPSTFTSKMDSENVNLVRLFLINSLREAWEEIGLNPFNIKFLGALPCYSLTLFARTIFPLVCLTPKPFEFKLSSEVEKVLEIPVSAFFEISNYALLKIETPPGYVRPDHNNLFPCLLIHDEMGNEQILWGATFNIIMNFLGIIAGESLPVPSSSKIIKKALSINYITGHN
jgi:hypothetical protein